MKRLVTPATLRAWAMELADIPDWLLDECVRHAGSVSAAIALVVSSDDAWHDVAEDDLAARIASMHHASAADRRRFVLEHWAHLPVRQRIVFTRLCVAGQRTARPAVEPPPWEELTTPLRLRTVVLHAHVIDRRVDAFTVGLWRGDQLVPLVRMDRHDHPEIDHRNLDDFVMSNTIRRVGPIRDVPPLIVIEIDIDAWRSAPRRKCGIDVRSARYVRTMDGTDITQASTIHDLPLVAAGYFRNHD
jgi:hypothetical protein